MPSTANINYILRKRISARATCQVLERHARSFFIGQHSTAVSTASFAKRRSSAIMRFTMASASIWFRRLCFTSCASSLAIGLRRVEPARR